MRANDISTINGGRPTITKGLCAMSDFVEFEAKLKELDELTNQVEKILDRTAEVEVLLRQALRMMLWCREHCYNMAHRQEITPQELYERNCALIEMLDRVIPKAAALIGDGDLDQGLTML